jgi:PAS domain S-box-containing protein
MDKLLAKDQAELEHDTYRLLFEHMLNGMAYCRMLYEQGRAVDWLYLAVNRAFAVREALQDVVGRRASEVLPGLRHLDPGLLEIFARVAGGGEAEKCEIFVHAVGEWFEISVYSPRPQHFVVIFDVVSERKQVAAAMADSEKQLRLALEGANLGTWHWDLTSDTASYSERSARLFGLPPGQLLDRPTSFRMIHRDDRALVASGIEYALAHRSDCEFEFRAVWPDGSSHWLSSRGRGSYDEHGRPLHMEGVMWDIDGRKRAEQDLRRSEQRFRGLFDCMREGFVIFDTVLDEQGRPCDWRVLDVNPSGCAQTAMTREQMLGHTVRELFPNLEAEWFDACLRAGSGAGAVHYRGYYAAAQRHFDTNFYALNAGQIACVFTDVTTQVQAQSEHQRLQAQFMRAQKMEAIGQLTGGIAHDFNNILTGVLGYAKLALASKDLPAESKIRTYLGEVLHGAERAADLVDKMQIFSRGPRDNEARAALAPCALIGDVMRLLRAAVPASIEFEQVLDDVPALPLSPVDLHQLLANLVLNSRDAILEHCEIGRVVVSLHRPDAMAETCNDCGAYFVGEYIELAVSDNGAGIPPERLPVIFDPFFTSKEVGKGTGLGLSVVHGIVHDAGGHIVVAAAPAGGTVMRLLFPV